MRNFAMQNSKNNDMKSIRIELDKAIAALPEGLLEEVKAQVPAAQKALEQQTCPGHDFLGWMHLPSSITPEFLGEIKACAQTLREHCDTIVVAGIGGSYLGARAVIEALGNSFEWLTNDGSNPVILFAGNNIGEDYLYAFGPSEEPPLWRHQYLEERHDDGDRIGFPSAQEAM